jgi:mevalonate kinase
VATLGGVVWFVKGDPIRFEKLKLPEPVEMVVAYSGIPSDTARAVAGVRERVKRFPERYERIFGQARALVEDAREALCSGDWNRVGELMNRNHDMLREIGVSRSELDRMVELARSAGALGAKLTGGGLGGCVVALTPGGELQKRVALELERAGFLPIRTAVGERG